MFPEPKKRGGAVSLLWDMELQGRPVPSARPAFAPAADIQGIAVPGNRLLPDGRRAGESGPEYILGLKFAECYCAQSFTLENNPLGLKEPDIASSMKRGTAILEKPKTLENKNHIISESE